MPLAPWEKGPADGADDLFVNPPTTETQPTAEPVVPQEEGGGNSTEMSNEEWADQFEQPQGRKTPHASRDRGKRQNLRAKYSAVREEAQLAGIIPTTPEGAVRNEVVDPKTQSEQALPNLVSGAIRKGWAVPDEKKPGLVDEMVTITENEDEAAKTRIAAFNALRLADQQQYERDHPEEIAKKGGHSISVQANIQAVAVLRGMVEAGEIGEVAGHITDDEAPVEIRNSNTKGVT